LLAHKKIIRKTTFLTVTLSTLFFLPITAELDGSRENLVLFVLLVPRTQQAKFFSISNFFDCYPAPVLSKLVFLTVSFFAKSLFCNRNTSKKKLR